MRQIRRITFDPNVMGGKPCIRGLRVTVGTIVGLIASGYSRPEILRLYSYLEEADIHEALAYAWRSMESNLNVH
jgi:uncharacterized protein (DUF433 family)